MENTAVLSQLYTDLGYKPASTPAEIQEFIKAKLDAADDALLNAGVNPKAGTAAVNDLRVMYAAYLYRHRNSDRAMPMSLRLAINDAKVSAATREAATK